VAQFDDAIDPLFFTTIGPGRTFGEQGTEATPDAIDVAWLSRTSDELERVLRAQTDDGKLDAEAEAEIAKHKPVTSAGQGLRLWAYLKQLYRDWREGHRAPDKSEKLEIARQLLEREPVRVHVAGRWVSITSRSRKADVALARHELQRREVTVELAEVAELLVDTEQQLAARERNRGLRRRMARLTKMHSELYAEFLYHTRGIIANTLSPTGRAAAPEDAPEWWAEVSPEEEVLLIKALLDVGPLRVAKLGPPPTDGYRSQHRALNEDFGFHSLLSAWEAESNVPPATFQDQDRAQLIGWRRAGAPYMPPQENTATKGPRVPPGAEEPG
jgi:hypothetical protein